jgi:hypothetical protein
MLLQQCQRRTYTAIAITILMAAASGSLNAQIHSLTAPDMAMQAEIRRYAQTLEMQVVAPSQRSTENRVEEYRHVVNLSYLAKNDCKKLVLNLAYYAINNQPNPRWGNPSTTYQDLKRRLEIPEPLVLEVLVPLSGKGDAAVDDFINSEVIEINGSVYANRPDFGDYVNYVQDHKEDVPPQVINAMYKLDPEQALLRLTDIYQVSLAESRHNAWATHLVSDVHWKYAAEFIKHGDLPSAMAKLQEFSHSEKWWIRLYVAHILANDPEFREPKLWQRLTTDTNIQILQTVANAQEASKDYDRDPVSADSIP